MDFIDKKEKFADLIEAFIENQDAQIELLNYVKLLEKDEDFKDKDLFLKIFDDIKTLLQDLSKRELKQRVLLIRSYL
ncbi:MAG: hypothetical protein ACOC16_01760 [Nanoarchaeota archaeon]